MPKIAVYRPVVDEENMPAGTLARRRIPAGGLRVTLLNNGKPKTVPLLRHIADELSRRYPVASVSVHSKPSAAFTIDDETAASLAGSSDLLISGLGDCGSCSACSLQDALQLERLGVPASVVITDAFIDVCGRVAARLGFPGYQPIVVPHPAATRSDEWLKDQARLAVDAMAPLVMPGMRTAAAG
ncbi:MAG: UGSC family (seleno)protein [Rhizobiaceae bacterium]